MMKKTFCSILSSSSSPSCLVAMFYLSTPVSLRIHFLSVMVIFAFDPFGSFLQLSESLSPSCRCVYFTETYGKEYGVFTSPNWPAPYEESIECILYTFNAGPDQLVEVTFDEFDLQKTSLNCLYGDYVKLFLHLDGKMEDDSSGSVNENTEPNDVLCGKIADIEQTHYSSGSTLVFEFHSDWRSGNNTGFRGTFRFLSRRQFVTDGILLPRSRCDYKFESLSAQVSSLGSQSTPSMTSSSSSSSGVTVTRPPLLNLSPKSNRGRFFSPQYPSTYPKNIQCSYAFVGQNFERVKVVFEHIILLKSDLSCLMSPDYILVHDGKDSSAPIIGRYCNTKTFLELISSSNSMYIQFVTRSVLPGQGFKGRYSFEEISHPYSVSPPNLLSHDEGQDIMTFNPQQNHVRLPSSTISMTSSSSMFGGSYQLGTNCDIILSSDVSKNGTIASPNYPSTYPSGVNCVYQFFGSGRERVQLTFQDFDLILPTEDLGSNRDCDGMDTVMVFITMNGNKERIDNFCGNEIPAQLMSNGPSMRVDFKSLDRETTRTTSRGFKIFYRFTTDFGVTSGVQDVNRGVCAFVFNSTTRVNGSFSSPNWPGLYPRDTECHYFFFGKPNERILITFNYFDIEGVSPCTLETASDYVEFSNYKSVDRKIPRHCGLKKPKTIESENQFFRVTFRSNDRFDGTGFEAFYTFRTMEDTNDSQTVKKMRASSSSSSLHPSSFSLTVFILLILRHHLQFVIRTISYC